MTLIERCDHSVYERIVTPPYLTAVRLGGSPSLPLLVLGPALGTSARALWTRCAAHLSDRFEVLAWDLPGHGSNSEVSEPFSIADLAAGVRSLVDDVLTDRGEPGGSFTYAGDSVGGAVGLQLLLDIPMRVERAVLVCTGAVIGEPPMWAERAAAVRSSGTETIIERATRTWFSPGFLHLEPSVAGELLQALRDADDEGYAQVCDALARFDVRDRLERIRNPLVAVAGSLDESTPVAGLQKIADGVRNGQLIVLDDIAHLAVAEAPEAVARIIRDDPEPGADHEIGAEVDEPGGLDDRTRTIIDLAAHALLIEAVGEQAFAETVRAAAQHGLNRSEVEAALTQATIHGDPALAQVAWAIATEELDHLQKMDG